MLKAVKSESDLLFRIGAVSRQAGIPTETIRAWERRYNVVEPTREGGRNRLYSQADIDRLTLIKQLVDQGFAIGTIAHLSTEELHEKVPTSAQSHVALGPDDHLQVTLVGTALKTQLETSGETFAPPVELSGALSTVEELAEYDFEASGDGPKVLVIDSPTVHISTALALRQQLTELCAPLCVISYQFGSKEAIEFMSQCGFQLIKGTPRIGELQDYLLNLASTPGSAREIGLANAPQYSRDQLIKLSNMTNCLKCECPSHTAALVLSLDSFEQYSLECENLNDEDAAIHARLYLATSQARAIMEAALRELAEYEKLDI